MTLAHAGLVAIKCWPPIGCKPWSFLPARLMPSFNLCQENNR